MGSEGNIGINSPLDVNQQQTIGPVPHWPITTKDNTPYFTFTLLLMDVQENDHSNDRNE